MSNLMKLMMGGGAQPLYVDDVFQSYVRTGTGAEATITTNIDMTEGYMLWSKGRSGATDHAVYDSARGVTYDLVTNSTAAATTQAQGLKSVSATGHTIGTLAKMNTSAATYVDWVFRFAPNFHEAQVSVKSAGSNATASFPGLGTLGMVAVKRTDSTGSWYVWHRSLTAGKLLYLEQTAAEATLGHITVSGTTVTLVNGVIADGNYIVYAWAHDTSAEGIIQCGSYTGNGVSSNPINTGFEVQYALIKRTTTTGDWGVLDIARGWSYGTEGVMKPNVSAIEDLGNNEGNPTATGFDIGNGNFNINGHTYIYLAIRRPNKPPTVGTQVYNAIARAGTGAAATVTGVGFAPDLAIFGTRNRDAFAFNFPFCDRLRGTTLQIRANSTGAESANAYGLLNFTMDGASLGDDGTDAGTNYNTSTYINHFFKRAPGFFDEVCYTGTGSAHTESHNLGVVPELMIVKRRTVSTGDWHTYIAVVGNGSACYLNLTNVPDASASYWNNTTPTASVFTVGTGVGINASGSAYVAYLFATLAGISKVGSYTGTAATLQINCGFTTGARFVLIKRTDSTGDWYVWDTVRGIIAGNDPYLLLNSTAAEVTTTDYIDPYSAGFEISSTAPAAINASGGTYIYLAIA